MQTKIEKELREAIEAEDRGKTELRELLKEEKEIAEGTRDRLTEICDTLRSQYTDNKSGQLSVVKETYHVEGMEDVVRYRAPTEQESREDRIKRGETTLKDAFLNNNFIKGITEAGKASSWVRDEDQGMTATLIRTILGERKTKGVNKETEYIRGRENIANELSESQEKQTKEIVEAIEDLKDSIPTNVEKDVLTAQEKEDKAEELNLFQKQNRLLQGILDNTKGLIKGTNGLQAVKDSMNATAGSSLLDNVFDLYAMKKGGDLLKRIPESLMKRKPTLNVPNVGDVIQKSKTTGATVLKRAEETLSKGKSTIASIFDKGKTIAEKAITSNASKNVINTLKNGTQTAITKGGEFMTKNGATKIPIIGGLIAGGINAYSYSNTADELEEKVKSGEITKTEAENQKTVAKGSAIGSTIGTVAGSAIGALGGPIGVAVGATVGEFLGDKIGGFIGGWFKDEEPKPKEEAEKKEPKKEKTIHEKWVEHQENLRTGIEVERVGNQYKLKDRMVSDSDYRKMVDDEWKTLRKTERYKDLSRSELYNIAKQNVYSGDTLSDRLAVKKQQTTIIAGIDEKSLDEYNRKAKEKHDADMATVAGLYAVDGETPPEYKPITKEDIQKAREELKVLNTDKGLDLVESERLKESGKVDNPTKLYQSKDKDGNVIGETLIRDGKEVYTVDKTEGLSATDVSQGGVIGIDDKVTQRSVYGNKIVDNVNEVGVKPRGEGFQLNANAEKQRKDELEKQKEVKVEVNNTNVQNVNQNNQDKPMYSQNTSPSYQRVFGGNEV